MTTGIGSLPFKSVDEAIDYSFRHDIPFLPELPSEGDSMLEYIVNPGSLSTLEKFKERVRQEKPETVKVQCVGPATLFSSGKYNMDESVERPYKHIEAILDGLEAGEIILYLDEPSLGDGFDFVSLWQPLFYSFDVTRGVHLCGLTDWDKVFAEESGVQIISVDASKYDLTNYPGYEAYRARGGRISWGVLDVNDIPNDGKTTEYREGDLITLPCGMSPAFYKVGDAEANRQVLENIRDYHQTLANGRMTAVERELVLQEKKQYQILRRAA